MFTSAMVGSLRPAADKRFLMATMAPPVFIVLAILAMAYARALPAPIIPIALCSALGITVVMLAAAEASYVNQQRLRQMRAELKAERDVLDARVRERTAQLEEAMTRAEAASRAKSQFIAAMSHELRTPLNAIIGFSEMAIDDIEAGRAASADDMARVRKAGAHLLGMINDVLDLAKAETDELGLTIAPADLGALIGAAVEAAKPAAAARSNSVELWIGAPLGLVSCDAARFRRALDNLLSNACKFTRDGTIVVTAAREGGDLIVEVRDSGQGMTPDVMAHLFEPFVRGDSSATRAADGAGLGLVVTRNIARAMGGDLTAESAPGAGATFTLRLPIADKAEAKGQAAA
jgi:signal transduction histidine kinase